MPRLKVPQAASIGLDTAKLYRAIDHERQQREKSLEELASELDVSYATLYFWSRGGGMRADALVRVAVWMPDFSLTDYVKQPAVLDPADAA